MYMGFHARQVSDLFQKWKSTTLGVDYVIYLNYYSIRQNAFYGYDIILNILRTSNIFLTDYANLLRDTNIDSHRNVSQLISS